jgi:hypothetical protein
MSVERCQTGDVLGARSVRERERGRAKVVVFGDVEKRALGAAAAMLSCGETVGGIV